ncbi:MAG: ATP-binding protein [Candidatus Woesearchaeota archaeon]
MIVGKVIGGEFDKILIRQKNYSKIEIGELLIAESENSKTLMSVYDLLYGSQLSQQALELISGMQLEDKDGFEEDEMFEKELRNYTLAIAKPLLSLKDKKFLVSKALPDFLSDVRVVKSEDFSFLKKPENPLFIGKLRSGSKILDFDIFLNGRDVLKHHVLIAATTGQGKSNLAKVFLWNLLSTDYAGILVIDPHDEYFGRNSKGLKEHPDKDKIVYYTPNPIPNSCSLKINLSIVKPHHLNIEWSDAQRDLINAYYKNFKENWIKAIMNEERIEGFNFQQSSFDVVKRKLMNLFSIRTEDEKLVCYGIFSFEAGKTTIKDIVDFLEKSRVVIVDTSTLDNDVELLVSSMISNEILSRYKYYKLNSMLDSKPLISILLEEAPRVLNNEALQSNNIFLTIAMEGRKFNIGIIAITQLPSLIPREILANMNTKIILALEMQPERKAIIESSSQDLSDVYKSIASLDIGEAIVSSSFIKFPIPVKIPLFDFVVDESINEQKKKNVKTGFAGLTIR